MASRELLVCEEALLDEGGEGDGGGRMLRVASDVVIVRGVELEALRSQGRHTQPD